ncbi:lysylphosphatidylglycerol synthase domain-containing protein [Variovorax dokdonensis]|uniref:Lysylphosphatidylglycerol synthase domain-containing protein n=1 Tax=Variovorax dokdonensis TaxID=344883 RepID=A0ABT7NFP7_9BURK|nr:lysylphosphatidylglycerol synthase domain-containing protein [Variovorax dokdonensis]MDM0046771.1 lysylphosphatidylglycerol synthase domain-containing protein [Variovorax dokdonensis]
MSAGLAEPDREMSGRPAPVPGKLRRWGRRGLLLVFFAAIGGLLWRQARTIEWGQVLQAASDLPWTTLLAATAIAAASHALYSTYDLFGRRLTGHTLGAGTVMGVTFISYAFNLNLGSMVGGIAFRYRLYGRLGLRAHQTTRILGMSLATNWSGYLLVAGTAFFFWPPELPPSWKLDSGGLHIAGGIGLVLSAAYVLLCAWSHGRRWIVRGHRIELPGLRMALVQVLVASINWCLIGAVVWVLLQGRVDYPHVLAVLLCSVVAGLIVRVPGGLGVLEAVFVALLDYRVPQSELLAALLVYRAVYYLLPLLLASLAYALTEVRARRLRASAAARGAARAAAVQRRA